MTQQINRRTVTKGIAWSVPAVAIAGAAPAFASSPPKVTIESTGLACKLPGKSCNNQVGVVKGYVIRVKACSTADVTVTITIDTTTDELRLNDVVKQIETVNPVSFTLDPNQCKNVDIAIQGEPNSQESSISYSAEFTWETTDGLFSGVGELNASAATTPPCKYGPSPGCLPGPVDGSARFAAADTADPETEAPESEAPKDASQESTPEASPEASEQADIELNEDSGTEEIEEAPAELTDEEPSADVEDASIESETE